MILLVIFVFFVGSGWLVGKLFANFLFPKNEDNSVIEDKHSKTIINNYTIENHLHISKDEMMSLNNNNQ